MYMSRGDITHWEAASTCAGLGGELSPSLLEVGSMEHLAWLIIVHTWGSSGLLRASRSSRGKIGTHMGIDSGSNSSSDSSGCSPGGKEGLPWGKDPQWESSWSDPAWSSSSQHLHSY